MNPQNLFDSFEFKDQLLLNEYVNTISTVQADLFISHWHRMFLCKTDARAGKFVRKTCLVSRFKQTWAKFSMNLDSAANYFPG